MTGATYSLAQIYCACGCSLSWKGLTTSPNRYFSQDHARNAMYRKSGALDFSQDGFKGAQDLAKATIKEMAGSGATARKIRNQLNAMGLLNGRGVGFSTSDVLRLLEAMKE